MEDKKNAKSPDDQLVQDMNKGYLNPDEKAINIDYLDPISALGPDKSLKRTGFGITKQTKKLGTLLFRFENGGKLDGDNNLIEPLTPEDEDQLEKELKQFFKDTITPLTNEEAKTYGITEFIYLRRAIEMRQARANGVTPEEFVESEKKDRELQARRQIAMKEMAIKAMEKGDKDFIDAINKANETIKEE